MKGILEKIDRGASVDNEECYIALAKQMAKAYDENIKAGKTMMAKEGAVLHGLVNSEKADVTKISDWLIQADFFKQQNFHTALTSLEFTKKPSLEFTKSPSINTGALKRFFTQYIPILTEGSYDKIKSEINVGLPPAQQQQKSSSSNNKLVDKKGGVSAVLDALPGNKKTKHDKKKPRISSKQLPSSTTRSTRSISADSNDSIDKLLYDDNYFNDTRKVEDASSLSSTPDWMKSIIDGVVPEIGAVGTQSPRRAGSGTPSHVSLLGSPSDNWSDGVQSRRSGDILEGLPDSDFYPRRH